MKKCALFLLLCAICCFSVSNMKAQSFFSARLGAVVANVNSTVNGVKIDTKSNLDLQIGIALDLGIIPAFSIQPEITYLGRSYEADIVGVGVRQNLAYVDVGALAKLRFGADDPIGAYIGAGPFLNYAISGTTKVGDLKESIDFVEDQVKRSDFSIATALGLTLNLANMGFFADVRYILGLGDIDESNDSETKNRTIGITAGLMIPL